MVFQPENMLHIIGHVKRHAVDFTNRHCLTLRLINGHGKCQANWKWNGWIWRDHWDSWKENNFTFKFYVLSFIFKTIPTIQQIHKLTDQIATSFEKKEFCSGVFLDFAQAFDRVWHIGLLYKLKLFLSKIC